MLRPLLSLLLTFLTLQAALGADADRESTIIAVANLLTGPAGGIEARWQPLIAESDRPELLKKISQVRKHVAGARSRSVEIESETACRILYGFPDHEYWVDLRLSPSDPKQLVSITSRRVALDKADAAPITWETLDAAMQRAADQGFAGAALVTRNGQIVLHEAYGLANREKKIPNSPDTVFAIGSAPIDFTHAAILLLKDRGKVSIDDPITKFFDDVPEDKASITIGHLMTGRSGLPDFHELPGDENPDHTWIDRDEAVRRIMDQQLLFEPGQGPRASHSAWGLVAAIVEIVSGKSYPEFTKQELFEPAGMRDTGFFGESVDEDRVAVGYGLVSSTPNSPPHWGPTSWMVMGSGGQVSTLKDMYRWEIAMRNQSILSAESTAAYLRTRNGTCQDGDSFGFEFMHSTDPDQLFMLISNAIKTREDRRAFDRLGGRLEALIEGLAE